MKKINTTQNINKTKERLTFLSFLIDKKELLLYNDI